MNLIFFGSDRFAVPSLRRIFDSHHKILCVTTQPDSRAGRGLAVVATPIKQMAQEFNLPLYQPQDVNSNASYEFLKSLHPDLLCVVAFGQILSRSILEIPKIMAVNLHASLLPKYRGAAPINWALIKGETQTGVSVIKMSQKMDAGPIILQKSLDIKESDNAQTLEDKLSTLGADLVLEVLDLIQADRYSLIEQDEKDATYAAKMKKEDGLILWGKPARDIFNLIRGCVGWPGAFTYYQDKILKIHKASRVSGYQGIRVSGTGGEILKVSKEGILVAATEGCLLIEELQLEGKRKMTAAEFITGHKICVGQMLSEKK